MLHPMLKEVQMIYCITIDIIVDIKFDILSVAIYDVTGNLALPEKVGAISATFYQHLTPALKNWVA